MKLWTCVLLMASALVFAVAPSKVLVFGKGEPFSQARYRFA